MFKKFNYAEDVAGRQNVKSSVQRGIKAKIVDTFPKIEAVIEDIIPKKSQLTLVKWYDPVVRGLIAASREHISLLTLENEVVFFQRFDEPYMPSLKLVHKCSPRLSLVVTIDPDVFTKVQVDRGAIKFVLAGANIMFLPRQWIVLIQGVPDSRRKEHGWMVISP
jgi:malignant T-cell-amplified sequence